MLSLLASNSWAQDPLASASRLAGTTVVSHYPTVPGASLGFDCEEIILIILFNFRQGYPLTDYCSLSWILIYFHKLISQAGFLGPDV